jgi:hypothetical protein
MKINSKEINKLNIIHKETNLSSLILNSENLIFLGEDGLKRVLKLYSKFITILRRKEQKQDYVDKKRTKYRENEAVINAQKKKERNQKIIKLYKEGLTNSAIARSFNPKISRTTVIKVLKQFKIQKAFKEGKTVLQISKELELDFIYVHNSLGKLGLVIPEYIPRPILKKC